MTPSLPLVSFYANKHSEPLLSVKKLDNLINSEVKIYKVFFLNRYKIT